MRIYYLIADRVRVYNRSDVDSYFGMTLENGYSRVANFELKIIKAR